MTIHEIDKQISALRLQREKLEREDIAEFKERAKANIGRCFKVNDEVYVKVIGTPVEAETKTGPVFNRYQYPALYLGGLGVIPCYEDTLFSGTWGDGNGLIGPCYEEISPLEFDEEFKKRMAEFERRIISCSGEVEHD